MNIIITAGGTIEQIDDVRTINNMSTGKLGSVICNKLTKFNIQENFFIEDKILTRVLETGKDKIFYIHSKTAIKPTKSDLVEMIEVKSTKDLEIVIKEVLDNNKIDIVVHSMAVSDYTVDKVMTKDMILSDSGDELSGNKISSDNEEVYIKLKKTPKIINMFKEHDKDIFLIGFKLLSDVTREELQEASFKQIRNSGSDIVIANDLKNIKEGNHEAIYFTPHHEKTPKYAQYAHKTHSKLEIAETIENIISYKKRNYIKVKNINHDFYYDGAITGLCEYKNRLCYYSCVDEYDIEGYRIYNILELSDKEIEKIKYFMELKAKYLEVEPDEYYSKEESERLNKKNKDTLMKWDHSIKGNDEKIKSLIKDEEYNEFTLNIIHNNKSVGFSLLDDYWNYKD